MTGWLEGWGFEMKPMDNDMDHSGQAGSGMDGMMGGALPGDGPGNDEPIELLVLEVTGDRAGTPGPVPPGPALRDLRDEPVEALDARGHVRRRVRELQDTAGRPPLTQALGVTLELNGTDLAAGPVAIEAPPPGWESVDIVAGERIGITKAVELPWRFSVAGSRSVSRPWPS